MMMRPLSQVASASTVHDGKVTAARTDVSLALETPSLLAESDLDCLTLHRLERRKFFVGVGS